MMTLTSTMWRPMRTGLICPTMPFGTPRRAQVSIKAIQLERWHNFFFENYRRLIFGRLLQYNSGSRMGWSYSPASFSLQTLYRRSNGDCFSVTRGYSSHRAWWQVSDPKSSTRLEAGPSASMAKGSQATRCRCTCTGKCVGEEKAHCRPGNAWFVFYLITIHG